MIPLRSYRIALLASLLLVTVLGLVSKAYHGPADWWLNDYGSGVFYVVFWILLAGLLLPQIRSRRIAPAVLLATFLVEFLQLWHPPALQAMRATLPGRLLLGTTFVVWDFPHYALGGVLGYYWLHAIRYHYFRARYGG